MCVYYVLCNKHVCCVLCVSVQLVKGIRYSITVEIGNTQCKKTSELSVSDVCEFVPEPHKLKVSQTDVWFVRGGGELCHLTPWHAHDNRMKVVAMAARAEH